MSDEIVADTMFRHKDVVTLEIMMITFIKLKINF